MRACEHHLVLLVAVALLASVSRASGAASQWPLVRLAPASICRSDNVEVRVIPETMAGTAAKLNVAEAPTQPDPHMAGRIRCTRAGYLHSIDAPLTFHPSGGHEPPQWSWVLNATNVTSEYLLPSPIEPWSCALSIDGGISYSLLDLSLSFVDCPLSPGSSSNWQLVRPTSTMRLFGGNRIQIRLISTNGEAYFTSAQAEFLQIRLFRVSDSKVAQTISCSVVNDAGSLLQGAARAFASEFAGSSLLIQVTVDGGRSWKSTGLSVQVASHSDSSKSKPIRMAFGFISKIDDFGWTYAFNSGRLELAAQFGDSVVTSYHEDLPFANANGLRQAVTSHNGEIDMFFACSSGFLRPVLDICASFPNVTFAVSVDAQELYDVSGVATWNSSFVPRGCRVVVFWAELYTARYLAGIIAGAMCAAEQIDEIGFVAAFTFPQVVAGINAFKLGVNKMSPNTKLTVTQINGFALPYTEHSAAEMFLSRGIQMLAHHTDSKDVMLTLKNHPNAWGIGSNSDQMRLVVGEHVLTAPFFRWGKPMSTVAQIALDDELANGYFVDGGIGDGFVDLVGISSLAPSSALEIVEAERSKLTAAGLNEAIFCGPILDNTGLLRIPAGECISRDGLAQMTWMVDGIHRIADFVATPPPIDQHYMSSALVVVLDVIAAIIAVFALACAIFSIAFRKAPLMKASSWNFCALLAFFSAANTCSTFLFGLDERILSASELTSVCQLLPWWLMLSYSLMFGALGAKLWRIAVIFEDAKKKLKRASLSDLKLLGLMIVLTFPVFTILATWQSQEPLTWVRSTKDRDGYGNATSSYSNCSSPNVSIYAGVLFGYVLLLTCLSVLYAYRSRNAPAAFSEAKWIFLSMLNIGQVMVVLVPLNWLLVEQPNGTLILRALSIILLNGLLSTFIFAPKMIAILRGGEALSSMMRTYAQTRGGLSIGETNMSTCETPVRMMSPSSKVSAGLKIDVLGSLPSRTSQYPIPPPNSVFVPMKVRTPSSPNSNGNSSDDDAKVSPIPEQEEEHSKGIRGRREVEDSAVHPHAVMDADTEQVITP